MTVTLETIKEAKKTIENSVKRTPLIECPTLEKELGGKVYFKLENLQKTGSFKVRGALNRIANLTEEEKREKILTQFTKGVFLSQMMEEQKWVCDCFTFLLLSYNGFHVGKGLVMQVHKQSKTFYMLLDFYMLC